MSVATRDHRAGWWGPAASSSGCAECDTPVPDPAPANYAGGVVQLYCPPCGAKVGLRLLGDAFAAGYRVGDDR